MFEKMKSIRNLETTLSVSYMEIYKDEVYDLFVARESVSLNPFQPIRGVTLVSSGPEITCPRE